MAEDKPDFDENDKKIIQLYQVISELIDEQNSRAKDMAILHSGTDEEAEELMDRIEARNDAVLKQMYADLELKDKEEEEEDDEEDESDEAWEIYNTVVKNLNEYMERIADAMQSVKEQKALIKQYGGPAKDEVTELENLLNEQTTALEAQTIRSAELEGSLSQVLQEYSKRVNSSNEEINSLHTQLSKQNGLHQQQLREIRLMYETKINEMKGTSQEQYKEEVRKLLDSLVSSRKEFRSQIDALTTQITETNSKHRDEILRLTGSISELTGKLYDKELEINQMGKSRDAELEEMIEGLDCIRTDCDIDVEDDEPSPSPNAQRPYAPRNVAPKQQAYQQRPQYGGAQQRGVQQRGAQPQRPVQNYGQQQPQRPIYRTQGNAQARSADKSTNLFSKRGGAPAQDSGSRYMRMGKNSIPDKNSD